MTMTALIYVTTFLVLAQCYAVRGLKANSTQSQPLLTPAQLQQQGEIVNKSRAVTDIVFTTVLDSMDAMESQQSSLARALSASYLNASTEGISNPEVSEAIESFKAVMKRLLADMLVSCNGLQLRIEALRMGILTCQMTLNQTFDKIQTLARCTVKQLYVLINQIRNCTFRALTASKSEVAIMQDAIADAYLEIHNINMRSAHCCLMNPKNAIPCLDVLTSEAPDIVESAQSELPVYDDVSRVLEGINKCSMKIAQNVDAMCV